MTINKLKQEIHDYKMLLKNGDLVPIQYAFCSIKANELSKRLKELENRDNKNV